jgi:hypothetical protein
MPITKPIGYIHAKAIITLDNSILIRYSLDMSNINDLKKKYPYCYSVAFYNSRYFLRNAFQVEGDAEVLVDLFKRKEEVLLAFYEAFYLDLLKRNDKNCRKCIMSVSRKRIKLKNIY